MSAGDLFLHRDVNNNLHLTHSLSPPPLSFICLSLVLLFNEPFCSNPIGPNRSATRDGVASPDGAAITEFDAAVVAAVVAAAAVVARVALVAWAWVVPECGRALEEGPLWKAMGPIGVNMRMGKPPCRIGSVVHGATVRQ